MRIIEPKSVPSLGFLTIVEYPEHGLVGGYLGVNQSGRPLEFHCTAPIKPNRAQQVLYGPTLEPFLYGEQIGRTLLAKAAFDPLVVCTDREPALAVRQFVEVPVALVLPEEAAPPPEGENLPVAGPDSMDATFRRLDPPQAGLRCRAFRLGRNHLAISPMASTDRQLIADRLRDLADWFDLAEPFQRIREALDEARRGAA